MINPCILQQFSPESNAIPETMPNLINFGKFKLPIHTQVHNVVIAHFKVRRVGAFVIIGDLVLDHLSYSIITMG